MCPGYGQNIRKSIISLIFSDVWWLKSCNTQILVVGFTVQRNVSALWWKTLLHIKTFSVQTHKDRYCSFKPSELHPLSTENKHSHSKRVGDDRAQCVATFTLFYYPI